MIRTERLVLRGWRPEDREPFAELNADPEVMRYLLGPLTREKSDALADQIERHHAERGFGAWAVEVPGEAPFVGFVGLAVPAFRTDAVEIGWRLARRCWGRGFATEAAKAALANGFDGLGLDEIVAFTVPTNVRSRAVMERIGMTRDPADDFEHPAVPEGHPHRTHVLYRIRRA